jgi:hypothetical protein
VGPSTHPRSSLVVAALAIAVSLVSPAPALAGVERSQLTQVYAGDVFFIDGVTLRHPTETTPDTEPLYNDAGSLLGVSWGEWKGATASATANVIGPQATRQTLLTVQMSGLIPGGVYSLFYGTLEPDSHHPDCPGVERTLPLTSVNSQQKPDPSSFVASQKGTGVYTAMVDGDILQALQTFITVIYHYDGVPTDPYPNLGEKLSVASGAGCHSSFGEDAMRQLFILMKP